MRNLELQSSSPLGGRGSLLRLITSVAALLMLLGAGESIASAQVEELPLAITVAEVDGDPVVDAPWLARQVENANSIFAPADLSFVVTQREIMPEAHARLENRRDRHALGGLRQDDVINVFIVASLRDVDEPDRFRQGVHWRTAGFEPGAHVVIVSAIAGQTVLAHELGHFFGNPHSPTPGNIMSYERGEGPPFFDRDQLRRIARRKRQLIRRGEFEAIVRNPPLARPACDDPRIHCE